MNRGRERERERERAYAYGEEREGEVGFSVCLNLRVSGRERETQQSKIFPLLSPRTFAIASEPWFASTTIFSLGFKDRSWFFEPIANRRS